MPWRWSRISAQAQSFPLGTAPNLLHHVWESRKLAQKNLTIEYVTADVQQIDLPLDFGHEWDPHKLRVIEIVAEGVWPRLSLHLDVGAALRRVQEIDGMLFASLPSLARLSRAEKEYCAQLMTDGLAGKQTSVSPWPYGSRRTVLVPLVGFKLAAVKHKRLLEVTDPSCARLPGVTRRPHTTRTRGTTSWAQAPISPSPRS